MNLRAIAAIVLLVLAPVALAAAGKPLSISLAPTTITVTEGQSAVLTLGKSGGNGKPSVAKVTTSDGSWSGSVVPGSSFTIPTRDDSIVNGTRTVTVTAVASTGATSRATLTILDNDSAPPPPAVTWRKCADENQTCFIVGTANVRYGSGSTWLIKAVTGSTACDNSTWSDPTPGVFKECDTDGQVGTAPTPTPTPTPLPNNPCYDQNGALISSACLARACPGNANPVPYEQPCGITWKPTGLPPQIGGYVFVKGSRPDRLCCNGLIMKVVNRWYDASGKALDMYGAVYEDDPSGSFPAANPYWQTHEGGLGTENVIAVAP